MSLENILEELKQEYITSLPQKITEIKSLYNNGSKDLLQDFFHKLKGSGKTYKINEVSVLGNVVEELLKNDCTISIVIPKALNILERITNTRSDNQAYDIENDKDFHSLNDNSNKMTQDAA